MTTDHRCLTRSTIVDLMENRVPPPSLMELFRTLRELHRCEPCRKAIARTRGEQCRYPPNLNNPLLSLLYSLTTGKARSISHRMALDEVYSAALGIYRLLLMEILDQLPHNPPGHNQRVLLLFEVLLHDIAPSRDGYDLRALTSAVTGVFWGRQGVRLRAEEAFGSAEEHRRKGTCAPALHASLLALHAEAWQSTDPLQAVVLMKHAIAFVPECPGRKMELLYQLGCMEYQSNDLEFAWWHWLAAESLGEALSDEGIREGFLAEVRLKLFTVESTLANHLGGLEGMFYHCLSLFHSRCLGNHRAGQATQSAQLPWCLEVQASVTPCPEMTFGLAFVCMACVTGHAVDSRQLACVRQVLAQTPLSRMYFYGLYHEAAILWTRYPSGCLASRFLQPLICNLDRICPPV